MTAVNPSAQSAVPAHATANTPDTGAVNNASPPLHPMTLSTNYAACAGSRSSATKPRILSLAARRTSARHSSSSTH